MSEGIVLFAHGSRDPGWARPFEKIRDELQRRGVEVRLAYLEIMQPSLAAALRELEQAGVGRIRVVPVFLGYGGHLREDLPRLVAETKLKVTVTIDPPVGEAAEVIEAIASLVGRGR